MRMYACSPLTPYNRNTNHIFRERNLRPSGICQCCKETTVSAQSPPFSTPWSTCFLGDGQVPEPRPSSDLTPSHCGVHGPPHKMSLQRMSHDRDSGWRPGSLSLTPRALGSGLCQLSHSRKPAALQETQLLLRAGQTPSRRQPLCGWGPEDSGGGLSSGPRPTWGGHILAHMWSRWVCWKDMAGWFKGLGSWGVCWSP